MARTNNLTNFLTDVADAIRAKTGDDTAIPAANFDTEISSIETGTDTSDANATDGDILYNKTAYVNGVKLTGVIPVYTGATEYTQDITQTFAYDSVNGRIVTSTIIQDGAFKNGAVNLRVGDSTVATAIGLNSGKIKSGETIFGIPGKSTVVDTEANSTPDVLDIASGYTVFVNGSSITGSLANAVSITTAAHPVASAYISGATSIQITGTTTNNRSLLLPSTSVVLNVDTSDIASAIGLTPGKIKAGETIMDMTGAYTSDANAVTSDIAQGKTAYVNGMKLTGTLTFAMKSYSSESDMNSDLSNITQGEVVKVVANNITTFYVKETTMKKLVKEEDTISPEEYITDLGLATNILGSQS